jgi:D-alanyl-D-alanine endopeptidase (penicillin-binding protein 7)
MLANLLLSLILISKIFTPTAPATNGAVLGEQTDNKNNNSEITAPVRITNQILDLNISAKSAIAIDLQSGTILYEKNKDIVRPIASISKLMAGLVFLDHNPNWQNKIHLNYFQDSNGKEYKFGAEENLTTEQIFNIGLIGSINQAVNFFPQLANLDKKTFINEMNKKAIELNLKNTHFEDIAGLSVKNVSTVNEIAVILKNAIKNEKIYKAISEKTYKFETENSAYEIQNTNDLLNSDNFEILAGKTGTTEEALYCLTTFGKVNDREIITVILGASSEENRFQDTKALYWWTEMNYK